MSQFQSTIIVFISAKLKCQHVEEAKTMYFVMQVQHMQQKYLNDSDEDMTFLKIVACCALIVWL